MSATEATADTPVPSRSGRLLGLVRQLIDYGKRLAATLRSNPHPFGTGDIALILARITRGLLRAEALEARIIRTATRLDAAPAPPRALRHRSPPAQAAEAGSAPDLCLPTPEQIAAEVRRRPIGAVIADICRDLGIRPDHPLWRELSDLIIYYGGNLADLVKDILSRARQRRASLWPPASPAPSPQSPAPAGTGPP
jgi:hypothetical protein